MTLPRRALGATGHESSILALGGAALAVLEPARAEAVVDDAVARGVNHFDVAPSYGDAERRLAPALARHRDAVFLACKTRERKARGAREELLRSLERLGTDRLDLYQCHALASSLDLEQVLGPRGALEAMLRAREEGLVRFLGITGHHCGVLREALERHPFDTVMFPLNPIQAADPRPATDYRPLLETARARGVGAIAIKATARRPWPSGARRTYTTWYEPFDEPAVCEERLRFTLGHPVATAVLPSDVRLWPTLFEAALRYEPLGAAEQEALVRAERGADPLYVETMLPRYQAYGVARGDL